MWQSAIGAVAFLGLTVLGLIVAVGRGELGKAWPFLLLGSAETLFSLTTDFELVHLKSDLVYRRPHS